MDGRTHLLIGVGTTAVGLWGLNSLGIATPSETSMLLALAVAGAGSLAPDIDHPRATISRSIPRGLFRQATNVLLPFLFITSFAFALSEQDRKLAIWNSFWQSSFVAWALVVGGIAIVLVVTSRVVSVIFGHRGATHSLIFALSATILGVIVSSYLGASWWYGLVFGWGWLTHLIVDAMTEMGLPALLWPFTT